MNRKIPTLLAILIIFVVIAAIVGIIFWLFPDYPENEVVYPQAENVQEETANWQTYRNDEYGFEMRYPEDWQVDTSTLKIKNSTSNSYFEIIENQNKGNLTLDEWFREATIINERPTVKAGAKKIFINDVETYRINSDLQPPNPLFEIVGIANSQRKIFSLYAYSGQLSDNTILEGMLSTFRFIEEAQSGSEVLFVYLTAKEYDGNLGRRSGADAKCTPPVGLNCKNDTAHSLITVNKDDSIINMAENYNFNTDIPIYWYNRDTKGTLILANNWGEMTNVDSNDRNLGIINSQEEGTGIGNLPWTGGLGYEDIDSCNQWISNEGDLEGGVGPYGIIGGKWKEDFFSADGWAGISFAMICKNQRYLRCICEGSI